MGWGWGRSGGTAKRSLISVASALIAVPFAVFLPLSFLS